MKKSRMAALVLSSFAAFAVTACQQPAAQEKDGKCPQAAAAAVPAPIDPDCAAAPAK